MPGVVTLHEEIAAILADSPSGELTTSELAALVNARGRYEKGNGSAVTAFQIHGRTRNYSHLFERAGIRVRLRTDSPATVTRIRAAGTPSPGPGQELPPSVDHLEAAAAALQRPGVTAEIATDAAPHGRGLYAITATPEALRALGLEDDLGIIYVGKAESSLEGRDLGQHFASGNTGRSTLRRTLAALLADDLGLTPTPRNPARPADYDRYALEADGDDDLTAWMREGLRLAFWEAPPGLALGPIEVALIRRFAPPLNLTNIVTTHSRRIKAARAAMALQARDWVVPA